MMNEKNLCQCLTTKIRLKTGSIIAACPSYKEIQNRIKKLQESGFDIKRFSIIGRDPYERRNTICYYNVGEPMKYCEPEAFNQGLHELGIHKDDFSRCETEVNNGRFLLIVRGG